MATLEKAINLNYKSTIMDDFNTQFYNLCKSYYRKTLEFLNLQDFKISLQNVFYELVLFI